MRCEKSNKHYKSTLSVLSNKRLSVWNKDGDLWWNKDGEENEISFFI